MEQEEKPAKPALARFGGMTQAQAGALGGKKTASTHGHEFYREIGRKGGKATHAAHGHDYYVEMGKRAGSKGGKETLFRHGYEHFEHIGALSANKAQERVAQAKAARAESTSGKGPGGSTDA
jgi:general stress protein YciG